MGCSGKYMMSNTHKKVQGLKINILSLFPVHNGVKMKNKRMVVMLIDSTIMSKIWKIDPDQFV